MKHCKIKPYKIKDDVYAVDCVLGVNIRLVKEKNKWHFEPFQNHPYLRALVRKYNAKLEEEKIYYKSMNEAVIALEKSCNEYYKQYIEFYFR